MDTRPQSVSGHAVVALIATRGRFDLLRERALPSILAQTRVPDRLVIVADRTKEELPDPDLAELARQLQAQCGNRIRVTVMRNRRTRARAAGAWNTGIDQLHRDADIVRYADLWFVAILDDDDAWAPDHIESCLEAAIARDLNMVASGLIRFGTLDGPGHLHSIPSTLDSREQFIKGQHIQGSNLFVRLDLLLQAGCFDEHLPSCTDRDLCIRLADLPALRFGATSMHTVHHYADPREDRLSAPASPAKLDGLTRFWRKHAPRFDEAAREAAAKRAFELFGWRPPEPEAIRPVEIAPLQRSTKSMEFVVGLVTDAAPKQHVEGLLSDLVRLKARPDVSGVTAVVVENGPIPKDGTRPLHELVRRFQAEGLAIDLITIERQREDWEQGVLVDTPNPHDQRLPIAVSRTVLNTYVGRIAAGLPGAAAWILDDDKRLSIRVDAGGKTIERETPDVAALIKLRDRGVDVVIGPDTGAAPLPFSATLRMQLIDIDRYLSEWERSTPDALWIDRTAEEVVTRAMMPDAYYDLSRHTEHLETPFALQPPSDDATHADALRLIAARVHRLLAGEPVFRPLILHAASLADNVAKPSVQRGGSTIFFNPEHLLAYPQNIARIGNQYVRRSDMLTAMLMRDQMGLRIVMHAAAGVRHDRSFTTPNRLDEDTLLQDILGYALYRAASELMEARPQERRRDPLLAWSPEELRQAARLVRKYLDERLAAFTLSAWRVFGLADSIRRRARRMIEGASPWSQDDARQALAMIAAEMDRICSLVNPAVIAQIAEKVRKAGPEKHIRDSFASMDGLISEYRATRSTPSSSDRAVAEARERRARALLKRAFGVKDPRLLGAGGEGIVLTDERRVFKVFDLLKRRPNHDTLATLQTLAARMDEPMHLFPLARVEVRDETLLVVYPFEESTPYTGGYGADLLALLRECKSYGITFRNMHPKNLRVTATGLKLIDYGSDIRPLSDDGYRAMAERAWLTWRWPHRPDLDEIMCRALTDKTLPELDGFERFWAALCDERPSATRIVSGIVDPLVLESGVARVLDFGCGKKARSARRLAEAGLTVVGYDPGCGIEESWRRFDPLPSTLTLTTNREVALAAGPFDAVISSLVLCELGDGPEYEQALADIALAARPDGLVVVTLCNPHATFGHPTPLHRRRDLPSNVTYDDAFWYMENAETGEGRREYHRSLSRIERDLLRHGLHVERRISSDTVDTERFEPVSDFLTLVCRRKAMAHDTPPVSLLIKTCAMEAATLERQVRHLVTQLERPRVFCERVLVIDSRSDGFVRQHALADMGGIVREAERLRSIGLIDRVLMSPGPGSEARRVLRDWFRSDSTHTHSVAGAPLVAPLWALEQCSGEYVLQVDSDVLVRRVTHADDYLGDMIEAMSRRDHAVTASLSVIHTHAHPFTPDDNGTPWRVEARASLFHKRRLLQARPFPNPPIEGVPSLSWHRSMDIAAQEGRIASLRGASQHTGFVHPPNDFKRSAGDWMLVLDLIEKNSCLAAQCGKVDLVGGPLDWVPRNREEPFVLVITGRNVPPGRIARCLASLAAQGRDDWGAVVIDDGSDTQSREYLRLALEPWRERCTLIQPRERRGQMANLTLAIRHVCTNPNSVIVTLDLDDALIGPDVLDRVAEEYTRGSEVTVGSMLRTDKHVEYAVNLDSPRTARGGSVWQHLRSFRKHLFDAIPDHDLRVEGRYVDIAVDWAFMLPIVEMAQLKSWIREPIYLYEPSGLGKGEDRVKREAQIAVIVAKPPRPRTRWNLHNALVQADQVTESVWGEHGGILFIRHGERTSFAGLSAEQKDAVHLTESGHAEAESLGRRLGTGVHVMSSPVLRAVQTAEAVARGARVDDQSPSTLDSLVDFRIASLDTHELVKARLGWAGLMRAWMDGSLMPGILVPCDHVARRAIRDVALAAERAHTRRAVAVTHDFVIMAFLATLRGVRTTAVPYLAGVFVQHDEIALWIRGEVRA
jgi:broad specificity phosphatase PhoE/glycosyltransferase involved in cell wall biosynthesis/SAM-dependent methyltransferase